MTVNPDGDWPLRRLHDVICWLEDTIPEALPQLATMLQAPHRTARYIAISGENAVLVIEIKIPRAFQSKEFAVTRQKQLPKHLINNAENIDIERYTGLSVDHEYLYQRNVGEMKNLQDIRILQIGCGTIGGFLAQFLAQSGAGTGKNGKLHLIDNDILSPANIGRHMLGYEWVTENKASACKEHLSQQHPQSRILFDNKNATKTFSHITRFDLIINATGDDAFSFALNDYCLELGHDAPPVLHSWLAGNGVAAQTYFKEPTHSTCYRCISTEISGYPRFKLLKEPPTEIDDGVMACGDGAYTPFPVSRSATAAGLALDAILAWANGNPSPRFRTQILDQNKAYKVKSGNPAPKKDCPACQKI